LQIGFRSCWQYASTGWKEQEGSLEQVYDHPPERRMSALSALGNLPF
jgi:hypothetical protein